MNKTIALYVASELQKQLAIKGKMSDINYDVDTDTLHFRVEFHGWYDREKCIDILYNSFKLGGTEVLTSTHEMKMRLSRRSLETTHICNIVIDWVNLEHGKEEVPEIMQNLLSDVSYKQYLTF